MGRGKGGRRKRNKNGKSSSSKDVSSEKPKPKPFNTYFDELSVDADSHECKELESVYREFSDCSERANNFVIAMREATDEYETFITYFKEGNDRKKEYANKIYYLEHRHMVAFIIKRNLLNQAGDKETWQLMLHELEITKNVYLAMNEKDKDIKMFRLRSLFKNRPPASALKLEWMNSVRMNIVNHPQLFNLTQDYVDTLKLMYFGNL